MFDFEVHNLNFADFYALATKYFIFTEDFGTVNGYFIYMFVLLDIIRENRCVCHFPEQQKSELERG